MKPTKVKVKGNTKSKSGSSKKNPNFERNATVIMIVTAVVAILVFIMFFNALADFKAQLNAMEEQNASTQL